MPMYIKVTAKGDAQALLDSLRSTLRSEELEGGKWFVNANGDFQRRLEEGDARSAQAFTPMINGNGKYLSFRFANDGVYEPSDYAEYYGNFVEMLIRNHRTQFEMIRVQFDDEDEVDVERPSTGDVLQPLPAKQIRSTLEDESLEPSERIAKALNLIESFRY